MNSETKHQTNNKKIITKNEQFQKKKSLKNFKNNMSIIFNDEEEKKGINIVYSGPDINKKIKYITLDLLLKKIVIDDFIEKNQLLIYYFCQQCFCFIDPQILFNKIINCYNYYNSKGVPVGYLSNIITFFNILVIEMYHYYKEIKDDDPSFLLINNFYDLIIKELKHNSLKNIIDENSSNEHALENLTDRDEKDKIELKINLTSCKAKKLNNHYFKNKDENNEENGQVNFYLNNYFSINDNNNENVEKKNEEETNVINNENKIKNNYSKKENSENKININEKNEIKDEDKIIKINEEKKNTNIIGRKTIMDNFNHSQTTKNKELEIINKMDINEKFGWCNTAETPRKKEDINKNKEEENKNLKPKEKKHGFNLFGLFKKTKEKKITKSCDVIRNSIKSKNIINIKKSLKNNENMYKTSDEKILGIITDIKDFILLKKTGKKLIDIVKSIKFYKNVFQKKYSFIEISNIKKMKKSNTQDNLLKKKKKSQEIKDYFNILDWDEKDIGNKLMLISESLLKKVQRKELYNAAYLKKNKYNICPNVMENIEKFNRLSFFIILDIISYDDSLDRARMIEKWIKIEEYCKKINNFNDLFAINSALNNYIITGLQLTLKEVKHKYIILLKDLNKFCDCKGNYKIVRDYISNLKPDEYYVPYLGILLRDLAFYEENSKYIVNGDLINFEKIEKIQKILDNFFKFKYIPKNQIEKIPKQLNFFEKLENIEEEKLERTANNIEPSFNYAQKKVKRLNYIDKKYFRKQFNSVNI